MESVSQSYRDEGSSFIIHSAILTSERLSDFSVDIARCITDINIYEDITKPYLSGSLIFVDYDNIFQGIVFGGDEKITITIKKPAENSKNIINTFYIDYIVSAVKDENKTFEMYHLHLIEDSQYESNLKNVNKYYEGKPSDIITNILSDYLPEKSLIRINSEKEQNNTLKVIIPNLTPMEAIVWVTKKARSNENLPYFIFSSLAEKDVIFYGDLGSLLKQNLINGNAPFKHMQSSTQKGYLETKSGIESTLTSNEFQILSYDDTFTDDLTSYVIGGFVGASHRFIDMVNGEEQKTDFNITNAFAKLEDENILKSTDRYTYSYPLGSKLKGTDISGIESKKIYNYPSTKPYELGFSNTTSIVEESEEGQYNNKITSMAIKSFLNKRKLMVTIPGTNFIYGDINYAVGRLAKFHFLNIVDEGHVIDRRKSGDHLIARTVHIFKKESYYINMDICKLESSRPVDLKQTVGSPVQSQIDAFQLYEGITLS